MVHVHLRCAESSKFVFSVKTRFLKRVPAAHFLGPDLETGIEITRNNVIKIRSSKANLDL